MGGSPLASPGATRALLDAYGLATKHSLGQNFLVSNDVIEKIMALAELGPEDRVLEVGPGIGTLTLALLAEAGQVTAIEADRSLEPVLSAHAAAHPSFAYIMGDALRVTPEEVVEASGGEPCALVSNLPYNVAATVILRYLQEMPSLSRLVVMVQAEVADRICAEPGNRTYGAYTAKLSLLARVTGRFEVGPGNFMPPPHVNSAVVRIERAPLVDAGRAAEVSAVIDAAFAQRRKTIRNSMSASGFDRAALDAAFAACGIAPTCRAETLSTEDFARLAAALAT
ncbi:MAG TPA: 16S rRNA (adenine(1518)-N(6)/adenine(1519)-N(6))-dimethyltransferase RsmA [Candidatus Olsenella pullistercoris]|uniref:Ribosomal RNA small subunit methyltransferase A n=1 Tax=Candidatus Olsenella pullistercoris TaxID=2838712 RepID=A0A9D2F0R0_9ACTN|nr:16S rRNA (adenine(1518)-N(6)/adenine(1519)-N(6))-dimethyltransferase RsmA [Candidatus Olsenella pullistercoris]